MLTIKKAKWYKREMEKMRMSIISNERVEKEQRKIVKNNFIVCAMILHIITRTAGLSLNRFDMP
jgi:hypothetical protein